MSFLLKLKNLGAPNTARSVKADSFLGRWRHLEIAGEYYHQPAIIKVLGPDARAGFNLTKSPPLMVPEPRNSYDPNAVQVVIDNELVGYLSREQAVGYHKALLDAGHAGYSVENVEARIFGRPLDPDNNGGFGVAIYLPKDIADKIGAQQST